MFPMAALVAGTHWMVLLAAFMAVSHMIGQLAALVARSDLMALWQYLRQYQSVSIRLPYFSAYKTEALPFQNNLKNLDLSYKMDLDL